MAVTYTGEVKVGGGADVRELQHLTITKVAVDEQMSNNAYLLRCHATGEQVLIDAAAEAETILPLIGEAGVASVITTHQHWDHHRALHQVAESTGATTAAGEADADALPVIPDRRLAGGDTLTFGEITLDVIHLRGHTPGSVALVYNDPNGSAHIWTGDSLFPGGVGNVEKDPERFASLLGDVRNRIFDVYDDETWIYPGHGSDTTLGTERPHLQDWLERGW